MFLIGQYHFHLFGQYHFRLHIFEISFKLSTIFLRCMSKGIYFNICVYKLDFLS